MSHVKKIGLGIILVCATTQVMFGCRRNYNGYNPGVSLIVSRNPHNSKDAITNIREWAQEIKKRASTCLSRCKEDLIKTHSSYHTDKEIRHLMYKSGCIKEVANIVLDAIETSPFALPISNIEYIHEMHKLYPAELRDFVETTMEILYQKLQLESGPTDATGGRIEELFPRLKENIPQVSAY